LTQGGCEAAYGSASAATSACESGFPPARATARRLGLVTLRQMVAALVNAVEEPPAGGARVVEAPRIRASRIDAPG